MNKLFFALAIAVPLSMSLSGCVIKFDGNDNGFVHDRDERAFENRKNIAKIQLGASFKSAQKKLGVADFSEAYSHEEDTIRILYYRTHAMIKDGITTKNECTSLKFINGELIKTAIVSDDSSNTLN